MSSVKNYKQAVKVLRPIVNNLDDIDLRKKLTPAQKSRITRTFNELYGRDGELNMPHGQYRPRNKENEAIARAAFGVKSKKLKYIPVTGSAKAKAKVIKGKIQTEINGIVIMFEPIDINNFIRDQERETQRVLDALEKRGVIDFKIQVGSYQISTVYDRNAAENQLARLAAKYEVGQKVKGKEITEKNSYDKWLTGVSGFKSDDDVIFLSKDLRLEREKAARKRRQNRRKIKGEK